MGASAIMAGPAQAATQTGPNYVVNDSGDSGSGTCNEAPDPCTLRDAVTAANTDGQDSTITFDSSITGVTLSQGALHITSDYNYTTSTDHTLTIDGNNAVTINELSANPDRLFYVESIANATLTGLTLDGGQTASGIGGAVYADRATLAIEHSTVKNASASGDGGGVGLHYTDATITDTTLTSNTAKSSGGGIAADAGSTLKLTDSTASGNTASGSGGGVGLDNSGATITGTTLGSNTANSSGGGIAANAGSTLKLTDSTVSGNTANSNGGGVTVSHSTATIDPSTIKGNQSGNFGGGAYEDEYSTLTVEDSTIGGSGKGDGNNADRRGGGIAGDGTLSVTGSTITGNTGSDTGGGIAWFGYLEHANTNLHIADSKITGNSAYDGGGLAVGQQHASNKDGSTFHQAVDDDITNTTIAGNTAYNSGAGVYMKYLGRGDHFLVSHSTISGNNAAHKAGIDDTSSTSGGGIEFGTGRSGPPKYTGGEFDMSDSTISGNTADVGGGVAAGSANNPYPVLGQYGSIAFDNSTIASNTANKNGGGIYLSAYGDPSESASGPTHSATIYLTSTVAGDNTANGAGNDLDRADGSSDGGFDLSYSLVENPGDAPLTGTPSDSNITGVDPALGALADNGGPTETQLPTTTSPLIDRGKAPARLLDDQRGQNRIVEGDAADARGGDGADIGAVEVQNPAKNPPVGPAPTPLAPSNTIVKKPKNKVPLAVIKKNRLYSPKRLYVRGSAYAFDGHKVASVDVAIVNKRHGRCRVLKANGHFTRYHQCGRTHTFLAAQGTKKWKFTLDKPLPKGYYVVYSRAHDNAGHRQFTFGPKSRRRFHVR